MIGKKINKDPDLVADSFFQMITESGNFEITPCDKNVDIENRVGFAKLELTSAQKVHVSALLQQIPSVVAVGSMAQAYMVKFPNGLPHTLMKLKDGGVGSSIIGVDGKIIGGASFHSISPQAVIFGVFTVMSIASGQYFLSQINSELKIIKLNIDKILEFLYGDKKAELMSEISFAKNAYKSYSSIMAHEQQRVATIISLQESKKVAIKDIEFYLGDLDSTVNTKNNSDIIPLVKKAFQIKESLELSIHLYVLSNLLEVYYSQNHDSDYIQNIEEDISCYLDKCEKRMLSNFSVLNRLICDFKWKAREKIDKESCEKLVCELVESLNSGEKSAIRNSLHSVLHSSRQKAEYYLSTDGNVYFNHA